MSEIHPQEYVPATRQNNVNNLYGNHFRFEITGLPELSFFAQSCSLPAVMSGSPSQANPFTALPQVGDHLSYQHFDVTYLIDSRFKTYFSLYYWLRGYGFPHSYEEVVQFQNTRKQHVAGARPTVRELEKTTATLIITEPDTERPVVEIRMNDVFPTALSEVQFNTTENEPSVLSTRATFILSDFEIVLTHP